MKQTVACVCMRCVCAAAVALTRSLRRSFRPPARCGREQRLSQECRDSRGSQRLFVLLWLALLSHLRVGLALLLLVESHAHSPTIETAPSSSLSESLRRRLRLRVASSRTPSAWRDWPVRLELDVWRRLDPAADSTGVIALPTPLWHSLSWRLGLVAQTLLTAASRTAWGAKTSHRRAKGEDAMCQLAARWHRHGHADALEGECNPPRLPAATPRQRGRLAHCSLAAVEPEAQRHTTREVGAVDLDETKRHRSGGTQ